MKDKKDIFRMDDLSDFPDSLVNFTKLHAVKKTCLNYLK